ncbi:MAG: heme-binding protein [Pseudomonadota bacterium]
MSKLSLTRANRIISQAFAHAAKEGYKPLGCIVLDAGGNVKAFQLQDGASIGRFAIAGGKARGALATGTGSRWLEAQAAGRPHFVTGVTSAIDGGVIPVAGGVIARDKGGNIIAAVGISGDMSDADEACAIAGIEAVNLIADTGA